MVKREARGYISRIQGFSVNDGEGLRTTVFFAGCPLRCKWCANPETWLDIQGTVMSVAEVLAETSRDRVFYRHSAGGVTFSGGEPTAQPSFLYQLIQTHKAAGLHTAMETSGWFEFEELLPVIHEIDFLFIDLKIFDDTAHRHYTGKSNAQILDNIRKIGALGKDMVIRIPLIPGVNDHIENLQKSASFIRQEVPGQRVELLPYHNWAKNKYQALGLPFHSFSQASVNSLEKAAQFLISNGCRLLSYK